MISIIIPTLNADQFLQNLLKSLLAQTVSGEIIVIDSSSSDRTLQIAEAFDVKIIPIKREQFDHGGSRTHAAKKAGGDILVYLTQDVVLADNRSLELLIKTFDDEMTAAVYGRQLPAHDATFFGAHNRMFNYPEHSSRRMLDDKEKYGIKTPFLSNSFAAYRKNMLEEIGWFKENLISTEDTYAGAKFLTAGYRIAYVADAMVYHSHNYTILQEFKRYFDIGVFHDTEKWIQDTFGIAKGEGKRYVRSELDLLIKQGKYQLLPEFFVRNFLKYAGFTLGRQHRRIPRRIIGKITMHKDWWDKKH
jgi:rhamnosyltransferase